MCGIAGIVQLDGVERPLLKAVRRMTDAMRHRGPDDEGFVGGFSEHRPAHVFAGADTPGPVGAKPVFYPTRSIKQGEGLPVRMALGHRRLAIIDLSPFGHQPMTTPDGRFWIVYNGEIFNYTEVAAELKLAGVRLKGKNDTEVLLCAYQKWGVSALNRCNGMFAFAIWDDVEKSLFCARDRIGIKPFYYTVQDAMFIFASDIKTLLASGLYRPAVDLEGLYHAMSLGVAPRPMTCFKDVKALEQGHWLRIGRDGRMEKKRWWHVPVGSQDRAMTEIDAVRSLEDSLTAAVRRCLVADVPVGTFMSGGIDSTTVSAIAAMEHPGIKAFTLAFDNTVPERDELPQARATAAMYPMDHIVETVKADTAIEQIDAMIWCYEEPFYSLAPNYLISKRVARHGVTVVLNGLGGDELFGGYGYYLWPETWRRLRVFARLAPLALRLRPDWDKLCQLMVARSADRLETIGQSQLGEQQKQSLFIDPAVTEYNTPDRLHDLYVGSDLEFHDDVEAISYMNVMDYVGNHHVYRVDQFTMHFSLEARFPFLDHEVVEAAFRIPSHYKVRDHEQKYVLRRVAEQRIAPRCIEMEKKGFGLPMDRWITGPLADLVRDKLVKLAARGLFRPEEIFRRQREFEAGRGNVSHSQIWHMVAVEMWLEAFFDGVTTLHRKTA